MLNTKPNKYMRYVHVMFTKICLQLDIHHTDFCHILLMQKSKSYLFAERYKHILFLSSKLTNHLNCYIAVTYILTMFILEILHHKSPDMLQDTNGELRRGF